MNRKLGIVGAGAIGCYVGGDFLAHGWQVRFVGRQRLWREIEKNGLEISSLAAGAGHKFVAEQIDWSEHLASLGDRDVIFVTVKSLDTEKVAQELSTLLSPRTLIVSLQNGVRNPEILRRILPGNTVLAGVVPYNVVPRQETHFFQATSGSLMLEDLPGAADFLAEVEKSGLKLDRRRDLVTYQWGKLLKNLNNSLNALLGIPLLEQLQDRDSRKILAACLAEALHVLRISGIRPASEGPIPFALFPLILRLPTPIFRLLAAAQLRIDPEARLSMWYDLARARSTEIDFLNGEIVRLAEQQGISAPLNVKIVELIKMAERAGEGSPNYPPQALAKLLLGGERILHAA